jgi:hypothetical protein
VFLPSVPVLLGFAAELEAERDHVIHHAQLDPDAELARAQRELSTPDLGPDAPAFEALNASAQFDRVLYDGGEFGTATEAGSLEEQDYLGLPGLLEPEQVKVLLRKRQSAQLAARAGGGPAPASPSTAASAPAAAPGTTAASRSPATSPAAMATQVASPASPAPVTREPAAPVTRESLAALRKELNSLVGAWSHRTGQPHAVIHSELRRECGGPALPQASADQIQARIATIRRWALSRR